MPKSQLTSEVGHPLVLSPPPDASNAMRLPYLRLAAAVLYKSIQDLRDEDDRRSIDALMWLVCSDLPEIILDLLKFSCNRPAVLLSRGVLENVPGRKTGRKLGSKLNKNNGS